MSLSKADLLLHPVRMRIIQQLSRGPSTSQDLLTELSDVAQATFYRHLKLLVDGGLLEVKEIASKGRGANERLYALSQNGSHITAEEAGQMTAEQHIGAFTAFTSQLLREAETFFQASPDFHSQPFGYGKADLHLTEAEWASFRQELGSMIQRYAKKPKRPHTTHISLAQSLIPIHQKGEPSHE